MALRPSFTASAALENPAKGTSGAPWPVQFPVENVYTGHAWSLQRVIGVCLIMCGVGMLPTAYPVLSSSDASDLQTILSFRLNAFRSFAFWLAYVFLLFISFGLTELSAWARYRVLITLLLAVGLWLLFFLALAAFLLSPEAGVVFALAVLWTHARRYREHYVHVCSGGLLDPVNRELFRTKGRVHFKVSPRSIRAAFVDSLRSWISYNPVEARMPGLIQSPAGTMFRRVAETSFASLVVGYLTSYCIGWLASPLGASASFFLGMPTYQAAFISVALTLLVAPLALALYFGALLFASQPVLPTAMCLKETAFHPERWEGFLGSLEFTDDVAR